MKHIFDKIIVIALICVGFTACYDEKMEWNDPNRHPVAEDLPLALQEKISRYDALNTYTQTKLGVGISYDLFVNDEAYRNLILENFDGVTPGNEMKQDALMKADGTLDFTKADAFVQLMQSNGLTIYGHTLVWHNQQRASYLNSLIAPTILPGPAGESLIDGSFEDGMGAWSPNFNAQDYAIVTNEALDGTHSLQATVGSGASGKYDAQLTSPSFPIIAGHHYEISIWVKCSGDGKIGLDFPNGDLGNQYPWTDDAELAPVGPAWTEVKYNTELSGDPAMIAQADNSAMTFRLLLGAAPSVTYYIDNVTVIDLDAEPEEVNYVENGNFETGDLTGWTAQNAGAGIEVSADAKYEGNYGLKGISSSTSSNDWDLQFKPTATLTLDDTKTYTFSFMIKSDIEGKGRISFPGGMNGNEYPHLNWDGTGAAREFITTSAWKQISFDVINTSSLTTQFDLGLVPDVTYYIDNVKLVEKVAESAPVNRAPIIIEKTMEEKAHIIDSVLNRYVTDVAAHFAGKVVAWDVVNEALNDNGTLRKGTEDAGASVFYYGYYLDRDYVVTAFKAARAADPAAKLFINDYSLESASGAKLDGLIELVNYIETNGTTVDGIGTQLHLNINWTDSAALDRMFQKLGATGKLIKITELDVAISSESEPASPVVATAAQLEKQAKLYELVALMYNKYIPENMRYEVTVWGVTDNEQEHVYWLKNDVPCLWDANYARKWAYKGFCDGLAGRDVSVDFPGTLEY
ncbi:MAG: endo-1,4-beta-xylanase [Prevotellaceae bacterium]|jgi:GH35 family endo-1,4-beta-xylanase|nr:endo-1,4-beta-xylanase [Prevotellaceae bacterium]